MGPNDLFLGFKNFFGSTIVVEQLLFSIVPSILTFDFDLIFWSTNGFFWGRGRFQKNILGSTHLVEQLLSSMFPSILTFDFYLILGLFFYFLGKVRKLFWGLLI